MTVIDLPFPISTNRIWRRGTNPYSRKPVTYLSPEYKTWRKTADNLVLSQRIKPVKGPFSAQIVLDKSKRARRDCDNYTKSTLDFLQRAGIIENDRLAEQVTVSWGDAPTGARITLTPA